MPLRTCIICSKEFYIHQWRLNSGKTGEYCTNDCKKKGQVGEKSAHWKGGKVTKTCAVCSKEYQVGRASANKSRVCSKDCFGDYIHLNFTGVNNPRYKREQPVDVNKHLTYEYKQLRKKLMLDNPFCVECNEKNINKLEIDHIVPIVIAPDKAYDIANVQVLCENCHKKKTTLDWKDIAVFKRMVRQNG